VALRRVAFGGFIKAFINHYLSLNIYSIFIKILQTSDIQINEAVTQRRCVAGKQITCERHLYEAYKVKTSK
jgi:hypothetical protein